MKLLVITVFLILVTLPVPAAAGTLSFDVSGVLGPVLQGPDPIQLAGATFTATGAIDPEALPIGISGDSATYDLAGNLQITAGTFTLTGYDDPEEAELGAAQSRARAADQRVRGDE